MDGLVEGVDVCEGLVGEVMGLKIAPDGLDFIEFGGVFRPPSRRPLFRSFQSPLCRPGATAVIETSRRPAHRRG
jgi:hypothetical protein